jgi:hypothetical protein
MELNNSGQVPQPQNKNSKIKAIVIIIAVLFALATAIGIMWMVAKKLRTGSIFKSSSELTAKMPELDNELAVTQKITAATGGQIAAKDRNGMQISLIIPPGALKEDKDIKVVPFVPQGGGNPGGGQNPNGGGNNGGGNNGGNGGSSGNGGGGAGQCPNPPCNPDVPPTPPIPPTGGDTGGDPAGGVIVGVYVDPAELVLVEPATIEFTFPFGSSTLADDVVLVGIDPGGRFSVVPTYYLPPIAPNGNVPGVGPSFGGQISGGGGFGPSDPSDNQATSMANNEAQKAPGKCTPEFLQMIERIKNLKTTGGAYPYFDQALNDCTKTDDLKELCQNNPSALRRKTFEDRITIAQKLKNDPAIQDLQKLLNTCGSKYEIKTSGSNPPWTSSIDATVCGYLDDQWKGKMGMRLVSEGTLVHSYDSDVKYSMPAFGGLFSFGQKIGEHQIGGRTIIPIIGLDLSKMELPSWGDFNGLSQVDFTLWGVPHVVGVINLKERNCNENPGSTANNNSSDTGSINNGNSSPGKDEYGQDLIPLKAIPTGNNSELPPLAPLPDEKGNLNFPLVPLPGPK